MRLLVVSDVIGSLSSRRAGELIASGWSGAETTVVAAGESGGGFISAYAGQLGSGLQVEMHLDHLVERFHAAGVAGVLVSSTAPPSLDASSRPLGEAVAAALASGAVTRLVIDLGGSGVHDGGAGLLAALGATADRPLDRGVGGLAGLTRLDLTPVRERLAGVDVVGVVPADQLDRRLLGLRGITSIRGRAEDWDTELMLATDARLETFAGLAAPDRTDRPGAGACGGLGFAVLAVGGRLSSGPDLALAAVPASGWDLVLTGCSVFDFATRGGGVVAAAARRAGEALSPCVAIAGEVLVGAREMRTMGIEAAYAVRESTLDRPVGDVTADELSATAARVARSWRW